MPNGKPTLNGFSVRSKRFAALVLGCQLILLSAGCSSTIKTYTTVVPGTRVVSDEFDDKIDFDYQLVGASAIAISPRGTRTREVTRDLVDTTEKRVLTAKGGTAIALTHLITLGLFLPFTPWMEDHCDPKDYEDQEESASERLEKNIKNGSCVELTEKVKRERVKSNPEMEPIRRFSVAVGEDASSFDLIDSSKPKIYRALREFSSPEVTVRGKATNGKQEFVRSLSIYSPDIKNLFSFRKNAEQGKAMVIATVRTAHSVAPSSRKAQPLDLERLRASASEIMKAYEEAMKPPTHPPIPTLPEVPIPQIPPPPVISKDTFESTSEFNLRVRAAVDLRDRELATAQTNYRQQVEKRNTELKKLVGDWDAERIAKEKRHRDRVATLARDADKEARIALATAFLKMVQPAMIDKMDYDADRERWHLTVTLAHGETLLFHVPMSPTDAREMNSRRDQLSASMYFDLDDSGIGGLLKAEVNDHVKNKIYLAKSTDEKYSAIAKQTVITGGIKLASLPQMNPENLTATPPETYLQNPNLIDRDQIAALAAANKTISSAGVSTRSDDLLDRLRKIPAVKADRSRWLFVIGIERYRYTDAVVHARASAELFAKATQRVLGVSERNSYIFLDEDASSGNIEDRMRLALRNVAPGDTVYFYYAGHGIPDAQRNGDPFLLPADKIPDFITGSPFFQLTNFYKMLSASPAKHVFAFVDSCFSGATDGRSVIKGVAASRLVAKDPGIDHEKVTVISAGRGNQFANAHPEKPHRLFTYHLVSSLLDGQRNLETIFTIVNSRVRSESREMGDLKLQEPTIQGRRDGAL